MLVQRKMQKKGRVSHLVFNALKIIRSGPHFELAWLWESQYNGTTKDGGCAKHTHHRNSRLVYTAHPYGVALASLEVRRWCGL